MALPKKRTSKSRTSRRFSQYCFNSKRKLSHMADSLKNLDKPFIYDSSVVEGPKKTKEKVEEVALETPKKIEQKKSSLKKVDDIKVEKKEELTKDDSKKESVKKDNNAPVAEQKDKWFSNLFQNKGKTGGSVNNMSKKSFRRKSM